MAKEANIPPFGEEGLKLFQQCNPFKQFKVPGMDMGVLMSNYQRNMELMTAAQQIASESTKTIIELQNQYVKAFFGQWNEQVKCCCSKAPPEEKIARQSEACKETLDKTIEHLRDVNAEVVKANERIIESVQRHFQESLDESFNLATKLGRGDK